jgi:outer membrane protein, adhesin transport system
MKPISPMHKRTPVAALLLLAFLAAPGLAPSPAMAQNQTQSQAQGQSQTQNQSAPNVINIFSAMTLVDTTHPLISSKRQELMSSQSGRSAAWQQLLPSISASRTRGNTDPDKQLTTASVQQPLFAGGRIMGGIDKADAQIKESESTLELTRRDLMGRTAAVYIDLIKARDRLVVADKNVAAHEELLASIDRRVSAEVSPESDRMLTQSRLAQAQSERIQVALSLKVAEDALRELLGRDLPELVVPSRPKQESSNLTEALTQALDFSPEIRQLIAQEATAKSDISIQRSVIFPTVFVRHDQRSGDLGINVPKSQTYIGVEFGPGAGFSAGAQIEASERKRLAIVDSRQATEKTVRDQIRSLWAERESLKSQVASTQAYVESAQAVAESFTRQFTIGRKTWVEVLNTKREALLAELAFTEIAWNAIRASYLLEIQTGRLNLDQIASGQVSGQTTTQGQTP